MARVSKEKYVEWLRWVYSKIDELNQINNAELTGKRVYRFGFYRKKKKARIAIYRDEECLAIGMKRIEETLIIHYDFYNILMKGVKNG